MDKTVVLDTKSEVRLPRGVVPNEENNTTKEKILTQLRTSYVKDEFDSHV